MAKHYRIGYRAPKTHKLRNSVIALVFVCVLGLGAYIKIAMNPFGRTATPVGSVVTQQAPQVSDAITQPKFDVPMPWPTYGYAAFVIPKDNLATSSATDEKAVPIASLAKIITVLAILKEKPLKPGERGPMITLTERDVALVNEYARKNGTIVPVVAGEQISEYQAIQAILMVSSNNMADSLAIWAFGSIENYTKYANNMLKDMGLKNTVVADDASGYSPGTVSTATEMAQLGSLYMKNPVLREITFQKEATIPVAGLITNRNSFANANNMFGIKLGNTDEAGKCYLAVQVRSTKDADEEISIIVVLGANSFPVAAKDAQTIMLAGNNGHDKLSKNL